MTETPTPDQLPAEPIPATATGSWTWNNQLPPPGNGQIRTDSRDWAGAKSLCVDWRTDAGVDVSAGLGQIRAGDTLRLEHQTDATRYATYTVTGNPTQVFSGSFQFPVTYLSGGGVLPNSGTRVILTLTASGSGTPPGDQVSIGFTLIGPMVWEGEAWCKHARVRNQTFQAARGTPPLDAAMMVETIRRQQDLLAACNCPNEPAFEIANVTFSLPVAGVQPGQLRIINQQSATIKGQRVFFGPPVTCSQFGAYQITATMKLGDSGSNGFLRVLIAGIPKLSAPVGGVTATVSGMLNVYPNDSIIVAFENTSSAPHDVTVTTLSVGEVWIPT